MGYVVHFGDLQTGAIHGTLPCVSASCSDELRAAGSFRAVLSLAGSAQVWSRLAGGPADMWAVEWADDFGRRIVAAGPLLPVAFAENGQVSLSGAGLWWVWGRRIAVHRNWAPSSASSVPPAAATPAWIMSGWDLGTIMMFICRETSELAGADAVLPVVWEDARGGSHDRTYQPYDLVTVAQRVSELGNVEAGTDGLGGPDWAFFPEMVPGENRVQWRMVTGTQSQPSILADDPPLQLDASAPGQQRLRKLTGTRNGSTRATRVFSSGGGTEETKVIQVAQAPGSIRLDAVVTNDALDDATVQGYADAELTKRNVTPSSLQLQVDASWWWSQTAGVGSPVWLSWPGHPAAGDLDLWQRVVAWQVDDISSRWVTLTLADTTVQI